MTTKEIPLRACSMCYGGYIEPNVRCPHCDEGYVPDVDCPTCNDTRLVDGTACTDCEE